MKVKVDGQVWLPTDELTINQIDNIREQLIVYPRKTTDIATKKEPDPIFLYEEEDGYLGVPRAWYLKTLTKRHEEELDISHGGKMADLSTRYRADGPYVEQAAVLRMFEHRMDGKQWGGLLLKAGCAFGKTATALEFARRMGRRTIILVHKDFFLKQWKKRILYFMPDAKVGIVRQSKCEFEGKDFVIAMLHSLARDEGGKYPEEMYQSFGLVISDECFVGSTKVVTLNGDKQIRDVEVGDLVSNALGGGRVEKVIRRRSSIKDLRLVRLESGAEYICTKDHPWMTGDGWVDARDLCDRETLTSADTIGIMLRHGTSYSRYMSGVWKASLGKEGAEVLFSSLHGAFKEAGHSSVRNLWQSGEAEQESILFSVLSDEMDEGEFRRDIRGMFGGCQKVAQGESFGEDGCIGEDEEEESDDKICHKKEGFSEAERDRSQAEGSRRKREGDVSSSENATGGAGGWLGIGACCENRGGAGKQRSASESLQAGYCKPGNDGSSGGGRGVSFQPGREGEGQKKGFFPNGQRVESVSVPKPSDLERHGARVDGDLVEVFNLKVSGHPSYQLGGAGGGAVVHNCHRVTASTWSGIIPKFNAAWRLGLSATPRRKDGTQDVFFNHISEVTYSAKTQAQVPDLRILETHGRLKPISRGKYQVSVNNLNSAQVLTQLGSDQFRAKDIVDDLVMAVQNGRKVMVVSERIAHLKMMSDMLTNSLFNMDLPFVPKIDFYTGEWFTGRVWEKTTKGHRKGDPETKKRSDEELERAESANVIFATKQMVEEGLDIEALDVIVLALPGGDVEQTVGRVRRWCFPEPDKCKRLCPWRAGTCQKKPDPVVLDVLDVDIPQLYPKWRSRQRFYKKIGTLGKKGKDDAGECQ